MKKIIAILSTAILSLGLFSCGAANEGSQSRELTIYTHRHYDVDKALFARFEKQENVKLNLVNAKADELIMKMKNEATASPADVLITVDAGRLVRAKAEGLLQAVKSDKLETIIPAHLRDSDGQWFALTKRARIIVYNDQKLSAEELSSYEDLADPKWQGEVLIRSSDNIYNQSLLASLIAHHGEEKAKAWTEGMVKNFARKPKGNDRDQVKAVNAGIGDLAVVNTYYIGKLLNSEDPLQVEAGKAVRIFFPNQKGRGAHINVSGAGVAKHSKNKELAVRFIEFLLEKESQEAFALGNYEYPVNSEAKLSELLESWGRFKEDELALNRLGELNKQAVILFDQAGWP